MARKANALVSRVNRPAANAEWSTSAEDRQHMIREAAYYRCLRRGPGNGHELDDWLAAEAELYGKSDERQATASVEEQEFEIQQSGVHGFRQDEALKRIVRQHPQRGRPQVEDTETR